MGEDEAREAGSALDERVETQTLLLVEMMRRLGVPAQVARDEAARTRARAACAACAEKVACEAALEGEEPLVEPPPFCANAEYLRRLGGGRRPS